MIERVTYTTQPSAQSMGRYITVYAPDGSYVSRHINMEECTESALAHAQDNEISGTYRFVPPEKHMSVQIIKTTPGRFTGSFAANPASGRTNAIGVAATWDTQNPQGGALYDLTGIPARFEAVQFATPPTTTNTEVVSNSIEFRQALVSGNRIIMNPGTYSGETIPAGRSDIDILEASQGTVFFSSQFTIDAVNRVRITGPEFNGNTGSTSAPSILFLRNGSDIIMDQVKTTGGIQMYGDFGGAGQRINRLTIMNSDIYAQDHYSILCGAVNDLIVANVDSEATVAAVNYPTARFVDVTGGIYIDCRFGGLSNRIFRLHEASTLNLLFRSQLETSAANGANLYISPFQGVDTSAILSGFEMIDCDYYNQLSGITGAPVQIDNVVSGGGRTEDVNIQDNRFHCPDSVATLGTADAPFTVTGNTFPIYTAPPAFSGGRPF